MSSNVSDSGRWGKGSVRGGKRAFCWSSDKPLASKGLAALTDLSNRADSILYLCSVKINCLVTISNQGKQSYHIKGTPRNYSFML